MCPPSTFNNAISQLHVIAHIYKAHRSILINTPKFSRYSKTYNRHLSACMFVFHTITAVGMHFKLFSSPIYPDTLQIPSIEKVGNYMADRLEGRVMTLE